MFFLTISSFICSFKSSRVSSFFNIGFLLSIILVLQLFTGIVWYCFLDCSDSFWVTLDCSFRSIDSLWFIRSIHFWCAGFFFFIVFLHMSRSLFYRVGSSVTWFIGVVIFLILCIVGFTGYVLPNSSMSYWAWTVITSFATTLPFGDEILYLLWGGLFSDTFTLSRVATIHFLLPFLLAFFVFIHLSSLHDYSSVALVFNNSNQRDNFSPYLLIKDCFVVVVFLTVLFFSINLFWLFLKHSDDFDLLSSLKTPESILPELYYLAFYGMLRSTESKLFGLIDVVLFFVWIFTALFYFDSTFYIASFDTYWICCVVLFCYFFLFIKYLTVLHLSEVNLLLLLFSNLFMCFCFFRVSLFYIIWLLWFIFINVIYSCLYYILLYVIIVFTCLFIFFLLWNLLLIVYYFMSVLFWTLILNSFFILIFNLYCLVGSSCLGCALICL